MGLRVKCGSHVEPTTAWSTNCRVDCTDDEENNRLPGSGKIFRLRVQKVGAASNLANEVERAARESEMPKTKGALRRLGIYVHANIQVKEGSQVLFVYQAGHKLVGPVDLVGDESAMGCTNWKAASAGRSSRAVYKGQRGVCVSLLPMRPASIVVQLTPGEYVQVGVSILRSHL